MRTGARGATTLEDAEAIRREVPSVSRRPSRDAWAVQAQWPMHISPAAVLLAVGVSVGIGVTSGFYPAWRAAHLDPVEALRSD